MPTIDEWQQALETPRAICFDSTQELANQVNQLPATDKFQRDGGVPKIAVGSPEFDPPQYVQVAPAEILAALGRITTPRVDNLADISSTWAKIRYIWAIEPTPAGTRMCLSQTAREIDFHQKALLSDEMGVGIAYYVVENFFRGTNPVDVDIALNNRLLPNLRQIYSTKPDYLFEQPGGIYLVVECKGSQGSNSDSKSQLRRGLEQVPSLEIDGFALRSFVIGSRLSTDGFTTFIVDPPTDKENLPDKDGRTRRRIDKQSVEVAQAASLYQFVGQFEKARRLLNIVPGRVQRENIAQARRRIAFVEADYVGQTQVLQYPGEVGNIRIFQGIPEQTYQLLENEVYEPLERQGAPFFARAKEASAEHKRNRDLIQLESPGAYIVDRTIHTVKVTVVNRDGVVTEIEVS